MHKNRIKETSYIMIIGESSQYTYATEVSGNKKN
jgi:hypothetical protein